ncbi:hypothetical protein NUM_23690 [Actinocatenispora comari]|uniref:Uncharacterized protein n=1 Tax=Actinocatenispora comari TaxID=2807577 RepID=A0A8J4EKI1_9ACTN|nr:hypothetical protein NUM_23690 [Actinocatenispora comari]
MHSAGIHAALALGGGAASGTVMPDTVAAERHAAATVAPRQEPTGDDRHCGAARHTPQLPRDATAARTERPGAELPVSVRR